MQDYYLCYTKFIRPILFIIKYSFVRILFKLYLYEIIYRRIFIKHLINNISFLLFN